MRLGRQAAVHAASQHFADGRVVAHANETGNESMLRTRKDRCLVLAGPAKDLDGIVQRRCQWTSNVDRFAGLQNGRDLVQVLTTVEAHYQHGVNPPEQHVDRIDQVGLGVGGVAVGVSVGVADIGRLETCVRC